MKNYAGFHLFNGIFNVREVNEATSRMGGFHILAGTSVPVADWASWRIEGMYNMGYRRHPSTNYSSFTFRSGFEFGNEKSKILPYFLLGAGIVAFDPAGRHMQEGHVFSGTFGVKVPVSDTWFFDMALEYSYSKFDFVTVPGDTTVDRMGLAMGVVKTF